MKILLMEDDPVLGDIIADYLRASYIVERVFDSEEAQELIDNSSYDLFIFDINVPGRSGLDLLKELRSFSDTTPTIVITAYESIEYLKRSFDVGAHDYIRKPFALEELQIRIENTKILFRIEQDSPISLGDTITYYPLMHMVRNGKREHKLRPKEMRILEYFVAHHHRVISSEELMQNIWEFDTIPSHATLRSYIRNLREAIGPEKIVTQRGVGYRYESS